MGPGTEQPPLAPDERLEGAFAETAGNGGTGPPASAASGPVEDVAHEEAKAGHRRATEGAESTDGTADVGPVPPGPPGPAPAPEADFAALLVEVERQRDEYLDALRRSQADFDNYRKRVERQRHEAADNATAALVKALLPALDTADLALVHGGGEDVKQVASALFEALAKEGLERIDPEGQAFDPEHHDAIAHEPAEAPNEEGANEEGCYQQPLVSEVMRAGYRWRGRVIRPAMVKVKG